MCCKYCLVYTCGRMLERVMRWSIVRAKLGASVRAFKVQAQIQEFRWLKILREFFQRW